VTGQAPELTCPNCQAVFPAGSFCPACGPVPLREAAAPENLEEILRASQGITPDMSGAVRAMAETHAMWRQAWTDTGRFSDDEAFELVRIIVATSAGGLRSLD
jgi:hypothetical protein